VKTLTGDRKVRWQFTRLKPMTHDPSSPSKLQVAESRTRNSAFLSCILIKDFVWYQKLGTEQNLRYCSQVTGTRFCCK